MIETFRNILLGLLFDDGGIIGYDLTRHLEPTEKQDRHLVRALNIAFLVALAGHGHPARERAIALLKVMSKTAAWSGVSSFYLEGVRKILLELDALESDAAVQVALIELEEWLKDTEHRHHPDLTAEKTWAVFFPEAVGIRGREAEMRDRLRRRRTVKITAPNPKPIADPARELLFTANILLTLPGKGSDLPHPDFRQKLAVVTGEPQRYWFDHPIPMGIAPENNEILYGLRKLDEAVAFEKQWGACPKNARPAVVLSVSTTHQGLQNLARPYVAAEIERDGGYPNLTVYVFSETDTRALIDHVLAPAAWRFLGKENAQGILSVFGTQGEYGRHYSFLKAISALWAVLIDPRIRGTFKIDLDQAFPQDELVRETGLSAFEHFQTPLWGASGVDADGRPVELGMIAGALVNAADIDTSLFTPDVPYPDDPLTPEAYIAYSRLPQALSTDAEMAARYGGEDALDGDTRCLERFHVTGGTNGILVEALQRHRPFTPSFIGRAEDQAYIMSVLASRSPRLAYLHRDGLVMRHDKDVFAREAMDAARVGTWVGDYVRLVYFSWYARTLAPSISTIKRYLDPFSGAFISKMPLTTAYLRFALRAEHLFESGQGEEALAFVRTGAERIPRAVLCSQGRYSMLYHRYREERTGWDIYYDTLNALDSALHRRDPFAEGLKEKAGLLIERCRLKNGVADPPERVGSGSVDIN